MKLPPPPVLFAVLCAMFLSTGVFISWPFALQVLNFGLIYAVMTLGLNIQWGYAGLFNVGIVGFSALGGLCVVLVAAPPVAVAWQTGGASGIVLALALGIGVIAAAALLWQRMLPGRLRGVALVLLLVAGFFAFRAVFDPAVTVVEANNPATYGNIGGLGLPVLLAWPAAALMAAAAAWAVGKTALGLRSDYLAIATLGIGEIIVTVMKSEDWLARGVKNMIGLPRPVPYEVELQKDPGFLGIVADWGMDPVFVSGIAVDLSFAALFAGVLIPLVLLMERALNSPWGRMMRAIRDNEISAEAMGKDVTRRHLQVFMLGCAVMGVGGAMYVTYLSQLTPGTYIPLTFTFLIWVMVIVGGSGSNWGAVLGGLLIWWVWNIAEPVGTAAMGMVTAGLPDGDLKKHLTDSVAHMRLLTVGVILLLVLRFAPRGLIPEK